MAPSFAIANAFLLFASGVFSSPTFYERDVALSCPTSDGTTFTALSGTQYNVQCNIDHYGGDLSMVWTDTLDECINSCDSTASCVTVSWVGPNRGPCYMKSTINPGVSNDAVWGAVLKSSPSSSSSAPPNPSTTSAATTHVCPSADSSTITAPSGTKWQVECGIDHFGGDMSNQLTNSFDDCIALCDSISGCVDVSWDGPAPGSCYLKNQLQAVVPNAAIWGAKLLSSTSTSSSSSTSAASSTPTSTSHSCPSADGTTIGSFIVQCYIDHYGGDMGDAVMTDTLDDCFSTCETTTGCEAVSWVGPAPGRCYMKNQVLAGHADSGVWGGQLLSTLPSSTTSLSPSLTGSAVSNPSLGSGTEAIFDGPVTLGSTPPVATLTPLPPLGVDMGSLEVLTPQETSALWYGGGNSTNTTLGTYVRLNITFQYPSIVLDDSMYTQSITCTGDALTASFDNPTAFSYAESTWPTGSDILLITAASSCGKDGQNAFFLATSISFSGDSISAIGSIVQLADVFSNLGIDFGDIPVDDSSNLNGTASNSTIPKWTNSTSGYGCDSPSSAEIDGLPAVSCGPTFDHDLDMSLGFYSGDDADTQNVTMTIAPGLKYPSSGLVSRCWCCCSIVHAVTSVVKTVVAAVAPIVHAVVAAAAPVVHAAVSAVSSVAKAVVATVGNIASAIVGLATFIVTGNYSRSFDVPMNMGPPTIWCVNCGLKGDIKATGSITATPLSGFTKGQISMTGNLYAGLYIGLDAFAEWDANIEKTLFTMGLPGFSIPDIVDLGPTLSLGVSADLDIQAEGQFLIGGSMTWSSISATLDFFDKSKSSQSGFTPVIDDKIEADGTVTVTATLGLPVTLGFGINVLNGKWDKEVKLVDTPGIAATLEHDDNIHYDNGELDTTPANGCYGITWDVGFVNQLQLDLSDFDGPTFTLSNWAGPPLAEGCIGQPAFSDTLSSTPTSSSPSTSSSATPTPTPTYPPLTVLGFNYGASDQTALAKQDFVDGQKMFINTDQMVPPFTDPWPDNPKSMALLFEYGTDMRVFVSGDGQGTFLIGPADTDYDTFTFARPSGATIQILTVVYGLAEIRDSTVYQKLYAAAASGSQFQFSNTFFNIDTWGGIVKTGVIWYKDASGNLQSLTGRENTYSNFPSRSCDSMTCPSNDGSTCTSNGENFLINCEQGYGAQQLANLCFSTFSECIDACATTYAGTCTGVTYFSSYTCSSSIFFRFESINCFPFAVAQNPGSGNNRWSVTKVGASTKRDTLPEPEPEFPSIAKRVPLAPRPRRLLSTRQNDVSIYSNATASNSTSNSTDTFAPVTITDTTGTLLLSPSNNGSLFVSLANSTTDLSSITNNIQFAADTDGNTVFGDSASRLLHYFPGTMSAVGASRLRLAAWGSIPVSAQIVNLVPFQSGSDTVLVAVDTLSNYYWPFVCAVQGQLNKVFLVNDAGNGANVLENLDLTYTVVGGVASNCAPLALTAQGLTAFNGSNSTTTTTELRRF